jgi:hypothetical protein
MVLRTEKTGAPQTPVEASLRSDIPVGADGAPPNRNIADADGPAPDGDERSIDGLIPQPAAAQAADQRRPSPRLRVKNATTSRSNSWWNAARSKPGALRQIAGIFFASAAEQGARKS